MIEIRPMGADVEVVETPECPAARPLAEMPPLTDALVRDVLDQVRR